MDHFKALKRLMTMHTKLNPFEKRGNDESFGGSIGEVTIHDPLNVPNGPITRSRAK